MDTFLHTIAVGLATLVVLASKFAVAHDGPGILPQYRETVFGIFHTPESRDKAENTGIGLAIIKKIVEGKGGTIRLESQAEVAVTFSRFVEAMATLNQYWTLSQIS